MNPPVFGHGELRLVLLTLIAREPRHGYDLIHALNEHFEGDYSPSAGTIYPRLAKLQEEGLVSKTQDGRKTIYTITEAGRREVEERKEDFERITTESTDAVRTIAQSARAGLARARRGLRDELEQIAAQARVAAEDALRRERAAEEAARARDTAAQQDSPATATPQAADAPIRTDTPQGAEQPVNTDQPNTGQPANAEQQANAEHQVNAEHQADTEQQADTDAADPAAAAAFTGAALVRRVDVILQQFRMELRQDAREANQLGGLDEEAVSELETQLNETRRRLGSLLQVHR